MSVDNPSWSADGDHPQDWEISRLFLRAAAACIGVGAVLYVLVLLTLTQYQDQRLRLATGLGYVVMAVLSWTLVSRGHTRPAVWILGLGGWLQMTAAGWSLGGVASSVMLFYPLVILLAGWMVSERAAVLVTAVTLLATGAMLAAEGLGVLPQPPQALPLLRWIAQSVIFAVTALLVVYFVRAYRRRLADVRRLGEALAGRAAELQAIIAASDDGILAVDNQGRVIHANTNYARIWGLPQGEFEQWEHERRLAHIHALLRDPGDYLATSRALRATSDERTDRLELKDGRIIDRHTAPLLQDDVSTGRVWTFRDVTRHRRAEEQVVRLNASLEQRVLERTAQLQMANQELESFSYTVSHDLRAPLRSMAGFSGLLLENLGPRLDAENRSLLERIAASGNKMSRLIDGVLEYSRLARSAITRRTVDLDLLVRELVAELAPQYPRTEVVLGPLGFADADPTMIRQIFHNLIGNALKYSARVAAPRVEVGVSVHARQGAGAGGEAAGGVEYFVRDNGIGFDMAHAEHLFSLFTRLHSDPEFDSTGAGLAIVKRLVERHGGSVCAEAAPGQGATFRFRI